MNEDVQKKTVQFLLVPVDPNDSPHVLQSVKETLAQQLHLFDSDELPVGIYGDGSEESQELISPDAERDYAMEQRLQPSLNDTLTRFNKNRRDSYSSAKQALSAGKGAASDIFTMMILSARNSMRGTITFSCMVAGVTMKTIEQAASSDMTSDRTGPWLIRVGCKFVINLRDQISSK